jgi:hypothetical protein
MRTLTMRQCLVWYHVVYHGMLFREGCHSSKDIDAVRFVWEAKVHLDEDRER